MLRTGCMAPMLCLLAAAGLLVAGMANASPGPGGLAPSTLVPAPKDRPYPGNIRLSVDATDLDRHVVRIHETVTGIGPETVLLYPEWLPGSHAPEGPIDRVAGLKITTGGRRVEWTRDPVNVYAFRVHAAPGASSIDLEFDYLSPTSSKVGGLEISRDLLVLEWNAVVLYPAGFYTRQIPVNVDLTLPDGWKYGTALEKTGDTGGKVSFKSVSVETLIDSPVYAGRYSSRLDLDPGSAVPVFLNIFADRPELLAVTPEQLAAHRELVKQANGLFGSHHYSHYDFLYSLSEQVEQNGLEHHQSSENGAQPEIFSEWAKSAWERDLLPHEYTHSWNGKFRRPADLWTPNYNVPMQDSLLWVYEGQTQYWGQVLAARSGLWTQQQALDALAATAAYYDTQPGRRWRATQDTTNDEIISSRRPLAWRDWQRFEDYYSEGQLIWLDADTLIREHSAGKRSLDNFASAFFGINNGSFVPVTYTFNDVVKALNAVEPYDWASFLRERLDGIGRPAPLDGVHRGGYQLVYTDTPSEFAKSADEQRKRTSLIYSIGVVIDEKDANVLSVSWEGAAFKAGLTESTQILAVEGVAYSAEVLKSAIQAARATTLPIQLIVKAGDHYRVVALDYHGGLRYPHLQRDATLPAALDAILTKRE